MLRSYPPSLPGAANLLGYFRPSTSVVLATTLQSAGTGTPPAVTISGAGLSRAQNVELDIPVGGALATAAFRWRRWGGSWSSAIPTAASVDLSATELGLTFAFGAGTYQTDHTYRTVIGTVTGARGTVLDGESAATSVRPYLGTINGRPSFRGDGTARRMQSATSALSTALIGGEDTAFTLAFLAQARNAAPSVFAPFLSLCDGSAGNPGFFAVGIESGAWACKKRGDTGGTNTATGGTADTNAHRFIVVHTGTAVTLYVDGVAVTGINGAAQNVPSVTSQFVMFLASSVPGVPPTEFYSDSDLGEVLLYSGARSASEISNVDRYLKNAGGI